MKLKTFIVKGRHVDYYYTTIKKGKSKETLEKLRERYGELPESVRK